LAPASHTLRVLINFGQFDKTYFLTTMSLACVLALTGLATGQKAVGKMVVLPNANNITMPSVRHVRVLPR
jgi:hypothetical protein